MSKARRFLILSGIVSSAVFYLLMYCHNKSKDKKPAEEASSAAVIESAEEIERKSVTEGRAHDVRDVVPEKFKSAEKNPERAKSETGSVVKTRDYDPYISDSKIVNIKDSPREPGRKTYSGKPGMPFLPFRFISSDCD